MFGWDGQEAGDGCDAEFFVVHASEGVDAAEPDGEEFVGPAAGFEDLEGEGWVVVYCVDYHFDQVDFVAFQSNRGEDAYNT